MDIVRRIAVGVSVVVAILFALCVLSGACGYRVHADITRHGQRVVGVASQAGYQGSHPHHHH
jgi:hypothetical protein